MIYNRSFWHNSYQTVPVLNFISYPIIPHHIVAPYHATPCRRTRWHHIWDMMTPVNLSHFGTVGGAPRAVGELGVLGEVLSREKRSAWNSEVGHVPQSRSCSVRGRSRCLFHIALSSQFLCQDLPGLLLQGNFTHETSDPDRRLGQNKREILAERAAAAGEQIPRAGADKMYNITYNGKPKGITWSIILELPDFCYEVTSGSICAKVCHKIHMQPRGASNHE